MAFRSKAQRAIDGCSLFPLIQIFPGNPDIVTMHESVFRWFTFATGLPGRLQ